MAMALRKPQEADYAKVLFINQNLTVKEIAEKVGVTEKTLAKWRIDGGWDKLKRTLLVTKKQQIGMLYEQLEWQNTQIATRPLVYDVPAYLLKPKAVKDTTGLTELVYPKFREEDYPVKIGNVATSKEADVISKITASINRLETETTLGHIVQVAEEIIEFTREYNYPLSKELTTAFDMFINHKMSTNG